MNFKLCGVKVSISFWAFFSVCYGVVLSGSGQPSLLICLLSALLHECGHLFFITRYSKIPVSICFSPFEVKINCDLSVVSVSQDLLLTLAGPLVNGLLCALSCLLLLLCGNSFYYECFMANLCLVILNCLPVATTDGGQILTIILMRFFSEKVTSTILTAVTALVIFPLCIAGVYVFIISRYNFSLLCIGIYLLIIFINKELR